jgi:Protein of unknown function (DUF2490)
MKLIKRLLFVTICLTASYFAKAQTTRTFTDNNNGWFMYFGDHKVSSKWGVHLEAQLRRSDIIKTEQQLLLRPGINYYFNNQAFATVGYCYVHTGQYGGFPAKSAFPENRFWEQIQVKNQVGYVELINRFRLEQRYVNSPVPTAVGSSIYEPGDAVYTNRFRMLNRISIPFKGKTIQDKSLYISAYDELFVNFGKKVTLNIFDQNRAYIALGYKIPKVGKLEIGYLNQLIFKGDGVKVENNRTLQVGLISTIDFYKKPVATTPAPVSK